MTATQLDLEVPTPPAPAGESARCRMCRRELTDPTSRVLGIGPECLAKLPGPPGRVVGEWPAGPDDPVLPLDGCPSRLGPGALAYRCDLEPGHGGAHAQSFTQLWDVGQGTRPTRVTVRWEHGDEPP